MVIKTKKPTDKSINDEILKLSTEEIGQKLAALFKKYSLVAKDLILPSGQIGHHYIDAKEVLLSAEGGLLASAGILHCIKPEVRSVGGLSSNATSLVSGAIQIAFMQGRKLNSFFVRKDPRKFGVSKWVEGPLDFGASVCIVEDVLTDGANVIKTIRTAQEEFGVTVTQVVAVLDRLEGGSHRLEELGIEVTSLCTIDDVTDDASGI